MRTPLPNNMYNEENNYNTINHETKTSIRTNNVHGTLLNDFDVH